MMMMKRTNFLLLLGLLLLTGQGARAEKVAQALRLSDNSLHFVYDDPITKGSTYQSKTVSAKWSGNDFLDNVSPGWDNGDDKTLCTTVVFDASFASVRPKKCQYWFLNFTSLTTIEGLQYLNTSQVTTMYSMFANCYELTSLDLSTFNTHQVTNMGTMFQGCSKLQTLNLASFDTSNVDNMGSMFKGCTALTTIYVSPTWTTAKVDTWSDMFSGCTSLKGGNGTAYNSEYTGKDYARIDVGDSKGYLTEYATVLLKDDADNAIMLTTYNGQTKKVQLMGRTLYKDGCWNTLCLPFNVTIAGSPLDGAVARTLTEASISGTTLNLNFGDAVTQLVAGTPYIIKWENTEGTNLTNPVFSNVTIDNTTHNFTSNDKKVQFKGNYDARTFIAENKNILLMGDNNSLYYPRSRTSIGACRAYFELSDGTAQIRQFELNFGDEETTGIISMENGKLIMDNEAGAWYDLSGRKVNGQCSTFNVQRSTLKKGVYIHNGRKIAIK